MYNVFIFYAWKHVYLQCTVVESGNTLFTCIVVLYVYLCAELLLSVTSTLPNGASGTLSIMHFSVTSRNESKHSFWHFRVDCSVFCK